MSKLKIHLKRKTSLGIDLGHHRIKAVEMEATPTGWTVVRSGWAPTPADSIKDGSVIDPAAVGVELKHLLKEGRFSGDDVHIAAAGASVFVRPVQFPNMNEATLRKTIRFEASRYVPGSVEDSHVDFAILGEADGENMDVIVVAAPKDIVSSRIAAVEAAGLDVEGVDVEAFAGYRALLETHPEAIDTGTVAIIDIGGASTSVSVVYQGAFAMNRSIPYGGSSLTEALKSYFKLSDEDAEAGKAQLDLRELLTTEGPKENPPLRVIQPHLDDLVREVRRSLNYFQSQTGESQNARKVESIVLSGGGAKLVGLDEYLAHKLGLPTISKGILDHPHVGIEHESDDRGLDLTVAGGLAMRSRLKAA
jgi:type IV pilus assembly protein PilM